MGVSPDFKSLNRTGGVLTPKEIGINRASTFPGFCGTHDQSTFAPIETSPFTGTVEQCFLLLYRCICKELHAKKSSLDTTALARSLDKGRSIAHQAEIQEMVTLMTLGTAAAVKELRDWKTTLDQNLLQRNWSDTRAWIAWFKEPLFLATSGPTQPSIDFEGKALQDLGDLTLTPEWISLTFLSTTTASACVIAWDASRDRIPRHFIASLERLPIAGIPEALVRYAFACFENTYFSPRWWSSLSTEGRKRVIGLQNVNIWERREVVSDFLPDGSLKIPLTLERTSRVGW